MIALDHIAAGAFALTVAFIAWRWVVGQLPK